MGLHHLACRLGYVKLEKVTLIVSNEIGTCSIVSSSSYLIIKM